MALQCRQPAARAKRHATVDDGAKNLVDPTVIGLHVLQPRHLRSAKSAPTHYGKRPPDFSKQKLPDFSSSMQFYL